MNVTSLTHVARALAVAGVNNAQRATLVAATQNFGRQATSAVKAAVAATTLDDLTGNQDYNAASQAFVESLRSISVFDTLLPAMRRVPLRTRVTMFAATATPIAGAETAQGAYAVFSKLELEDGALTPVKAQALLATSQEAWALPESAPTIEVELRSGVAQATNAIFLAALAAVAASEVSSGATAANVLTDVEALLAIVNLTGGGALYLVVSPAQASSLATMNTAGELSFPTMSPTGGTLCGVPVLVSDQLPSDTAMLIDATAIAAGDEVVELATSTQASLQMDSAPSAGAQNLVSLFQTDLIAVLATRWFGFELTRASGVALLTAVAWG